MVYDRGVLVKFWCVYENLDNYLFDFGLMVDRLEVLLKYLIKFEFEIDFNLERIKKFFSLIDL